MSSFNILIYCSVIQQKTPNRTSSTTNNQQPTSAQELAAATARDRACPGGSSRSQESQIGFDAHEDSVGTNHQTHDEVEDAAASA